jgi:hypothetical protein
MPARLVLAASHPGVVDDHPSGDAGLGNFQELTQGPGIENQPAISGVFWSPILHIAHNALPSPRERVFLKGKV